MSQEPISGDMPINNPDASFNQRDPSEIKSDPRKAKEFKEKISEKEQQASQPTNDDQVSSTESPKDVFTELELEAQSATTSLAGMTGEEAEALSQELAQAADTQTKSNLENASQTMAEQMLKGDAAEGMMEASTSDTLSHMTKDQAAQLAKEAVQMQQDQSSMAKEKTSADAQMTAQTAQTQKQPSIFDLAKGALFKDNLGKEEASSQSASKEGPTFADIPIILNVSVEMIAELRSGEISGVGKTKSVESVQQISDVVIRAVETLAVRQVGGTTEVSMTLARGEVPLEFSGATLVVTHENNRIDIRFDNFASEGNMQQAEQMIKSNLELLLSSLATRQLGVQNIYVGAQQVDLPDQYIAHIASMQTNMTLEELIFGKKYNKDSSDSLDSFKRSQQGSGAQNINESEGRSHI